MTHAEGDVLGCSSPAWLHPGLLALCNVLVLHIPPRAAQGRGSSLASQGLVSLAEHCELCGGTGGDLDVALGIAARQELPDNLLRKREHPCCGCLQQSQLISSLPVASGPSSPPFSLPDVCCSPMDHCTLCSHGIGKHFQRDGLPWRSLTGLIW